MNDVKQDIATVEASDLFDAQWYTERYPDVAALGLGVAEHYVRMGAALLRDPGPEFSTREYLLVYPDVDVTEINPLVHYLLVGRDEGRRCFAVNASEHDVDATAQATAAGIKRDIDALAKSALFDARYYLDANPDVAASKWDPLRHYVLHGAREGRQPNPWFSTRHYRATCQHAGDTTNPLAHYLLHRDKWSAATSTHFDGRFYDARYGDVAGSGLPPLAHYLGKGVLEGRQTTFATQAHARVAHVVDCRRVRTTIIVPVYNALAATRECLRSVQRHTTLGIINRLLVIDDASTDPGIDELLDQLAGRAGIRVIRNRTNLGYTRTVNAGCELADADDVVLLNSDTIVGPHWLRNLKVAAYRTDRTGTVTAVSNNAGAFSVPKSGFNDVPDGLDVGAVARIVADCRFDTPFEVPTGNGFCLYIKRALIDDIGGFDETNFPIGYGEENEFCMRALMAGWCHRVDPATYVGHKRSASFGDRRQQLVEDAEQRLRTMCPQYEGAVRAIRLSPEFGIVRDRIARQLAHWQASGRVPKPRIMYVISTRVGGTPQTNADLMRAVADDFDCYALWCDRSKIDVLQVHGGDYKTIQRYPLAQPIRFATHVSGEYDDIVRSILTAWGIDLLHIRHLAWHSLNLVDVAKSLDIPVIHSFHDFYAVCPSLTLVDEEGRYHPAGVIGKVRNPLWPHDPTDTGITQDWLLQWQRRMQQLLAQCDAFITTCHSARDILIQALPVLAKRSTDFHVIHHGRDFQAFTQSAATGEIADGDPLRILLPGNIGLQKGMELVKRIKELDTRGELEFHLLGKAGAGLAEHIVNHGGYARASFAARVAEIRPHIAAILSIGPETWCHTLTECWASGIPVVGIDLGAIGERIRRVGAGWLLPAGSEPGAIYASLLELRTAVEERREKAVATGHWQRTDGKHHTTRHMADEYSVVYRRVLTRDPSGGV